MLSKVEADAVTVGAECSQPSQILSYPWVQKFFFSYSVSFTTIVFLFLFFVFFFFEGTGFGPRMNQQVLPAVVCVGTSRNMRYIADTFLPSKSWQFYWKLKASLSRGQWALPFLSAGGSHSSAERVVLDGLKKAEDLSGQDQGRPVGGQVEDSVNGGRGKDKFGVVFMGC